MEISRGREWAPEIGGDGGCDGEDDGLEGFRSEGLENLLRLRRGVGFGGTSMEEPVITSSLILGQPFIVKAGIV